MSPRSSFSRRVARRRRFETACGVRAMRFAASLEFLRAIDYEFPAWAEEYMSAVEAALGEAYTEPASDVRGYVAYVKSQAD